MQEKGDVGLIPGSGRFPGEGNGNPLQYSCLENPRDRGTWWVTVHGVAKSQTRPSDFTFTFTLVAMLSSQLCLTLKPQGLQPARLLCPWSFPGKNTKVGCHFLLQGILLSQGLNPHILHWYMDSLLLSHLHQIIVFSLFYSILILF